MQSQMAHYDIFRDRLGIKYPALGHALWEPSPGELYPPVEVGDVGFIREGKFHRLFNALLDADHPSQTFGVPEYHEPLQPSLVAKAAKHIDIGTLSPADFCSQGVTVGGVDVLARGPVGAADVSFSCSRTCGAVLSLPVKAQRRDTIARGAFGKWITKNIDSWFAFTQRLELGIEQMEDIVLVTGRHRTRSWTNIALFENSRVTLGVQVNDDVGANVNWQISREHIQGAMLSEGPSGRGLPEDQCIFVRGFRVGRAFKLFQRLKGAAGHAQDPGEHDSEPELEAVSIPSFPKYKDPLHVLLEYIAERAPDCDLVLVHDDDLDRLCRTGDGTSLETLQPDAVMGCLQRSEPEIGQVTCGEHRRDHNPPDFFIVNAFAQRFVVF
ncbi:hypothetical protein EDB85DRAFT_1389381 [Lactarius pseudohatsudake]|nr:hypothetical protein EDB85DRAFT_1389381 [Lactarius pseudohatsudake]